MKSAKFLITFKQTPKSPGLRSIGEGPRGWEIKVNGEIVGHVSAMGGGALNGPFRGWIFSVAGRPGIAYHNSYKTPDMDPDKVKALAKAYILSQLGKS